MTFSCMPSTNVRTHPITFSHKQWMLTCSKIIGQFYNFFGLIKIFFSPNSEYFDLKQSSTLAADFTLCSTHWTRVALATNYNRQMSSSVFIGVRANVYTRLSCRFVPTACWCRYCWFAGWMSEWLLLHQRTFIRNALYALHSHRSGLNFQR